MKNLLSLGTLLLGFALTFASHAMGAPISQNLIPRLDQVITPEEQRELQLLKKSRYSSLKLADLPKEIDFRDKALPIRKQTKPWCTAYGLAAVVEINTQQGIDLSERHLWSMYRKYSCSTAIKKSTGRRITTEAYWPMKRWFPRWHYKRHAQLGVYDYEYLDTDIQKVVRVLAQGRSVYMGLSVNNSMANGDTLIDAQSPNSGGGHAVALVGYKLDPSLPGGGALLIRNSWGTHTGDAGHQWLPFSYCERSDSYCMFWDVTQTLQ